MQDQSIRIALDNAIRVVLCDDRLWTRLGSQGWLDHSNMLVTLHEDMTEDGGRHQALAAAVCRRYSWLKSKEDPSREDDVTICPV